MSEYAPNEELLKKLDCHFPTEAKFSYIGKFTDYLGREESKYKCRACFMECSTSETKYLNLKDSLFS